MMKELWGRGNVVEVLPSEEGMDFPKCGSILVIPSPRITQQLVNVSGTGLGLG
jgi:hypothetical protein